MVPTPEKPHSIPQTLDKNDSKTRWYWDAAVERAEGKPLYLRYFMKRLLLIIFPVMALLGFGSCSEDFKVDAPYKHITVIYGLLNVDSQRNYIRIQKAFLDESKSALEMAQNPDSNYYSPQDLSVHLKEINDNGTVLFDETLNRVDLAAEGYPKVAGTFVSSPSYAYKSTRKLTSSYNYRIVVRNSATGENDSAETRLVDAVTIENISAIGFSNVTGNSSFNPRYTTGVNGRVFEGIIRFHYVDKNTATNVQTDRYYDYSFATDLNDNRDGAGHLIYSSSDRLKNLNANFYPALAAGIGPAPAGVSRYIDSCDLYVYGGSEDFYSYMQVSNLQGGITSDQVKPIYTNIKGSNVLGLFASRYMVVRRNLPIDPPTLAKLMSDPQTVPLNIVGVSDH